MSIQNNQVVTLEYELREVGKDEVIDSSPVGEPLEFITGKNQIIPGLESKLKDLSKGESADILVPSNEAYGEYNPEAIDQVPIEQFAGIDLQVGMPLYGHDQNGKPIPVVVKAFDDKNVTVDFNHPLAGKDLMFSVKVADVRDATEEEIATGVVGGHKDSCGTGCGCSH